MPSTQAIVLVPQDMERASRAIPLCPIFFCFLNRVSFSFLHRKCIKMIDRVLLLGKISQKYMPK
jgi:hypothetical protein